MADWSTAGVGQHRDSQWDLVDVTGRSARVTREYKLLLQLPVLSHRAAPRRVGTGQPPEDLLHGVARGSGRVGDVV